MKNNNLETNWNYGNSYLQTIRQIENDCVLYSMKDDYENWLKSIKAFYRELSRRMELEEQKEVERLIRIAERGVSNCQGSEFRSSSFTRSVEKKLTKAEIYLKSIITDRGMDIPSKEDYGDRLL